MTLTERLITCATCARRVHGADADALGWDECADGSWSCPLCTRLFPQAADADA